MKNNLMYILLLFCSTLNAVSCITFTDPTTDVDSVVYLFAHGLAATHRQAPLLFSHITVDNNNKYNNHWIVKNPLVVFDFPDAKNDNMFDWHAQWVNLGQDLDIEALHEAYKQVRKNYPDRGIILAGVSRGASTILNFLGSQKPTGIKAVIVESPFDTLTNIVVHLLKQYYLKWIPFSQALGINYMRAMFPLLKINGIVPDKVVENIDPDIPILFVHSKKDKTVPIRSSRSLYVKLHTAGHTRTHLFEIATGEHAQISKGPESNLYHRIVQAFYQRYALPCDEQSAVHGKKLFVYCQPSLEEVRIRLQKRSIELDEETIALAHSINTFLEESPS